MRGCAPRPIRSARAPMPPPRRPTVLLALVIAGIILTAGWGLRDPWPPDEPRFALIAEEMLASGDWLVPTRDGLPYADKPPLSLWLMAAAIGACDSLRIGFLLPSLLAACLCLALVYDLARRLWNRRTAAYAAGALLISVQFVVQARSAQIDALLCAWTTLGLYGLLRHLLLGPAWRWCWIGCAACGAGVITKGVGFLPLLVLLPWLLLRWRGRLQPSAPSRPAAAWRWALAGLCLAAPVMAWLLPLLLHVAASDDPALHAYRDELLFRQTLTRYADAWHHHHWFGYYLVEVLPPLWMPLTLLAPWLLPAWWRRLRRLDPRQTLLLGWIVLVLLFFSLSPGKRGVYVLPALPALVLAAAPMLPVLLRRPGVRRLLVGCIAVAGGATLAAAPLLQWWQPASFARATEHLPALRPTLMLAVVGGGVCLCAWWLRRRPASLLLVTAVIVTGVFGFWVTPHLNGYRSAAPLMTRVGGIIGSDDDLAVLGYYEQLLLHADRPIATFAFRADVEADDWRRALAWLDAAPGRWLLVAGSQRAPHGDPARFRYVGARSRRDWYLLDGAAGAQLRVTDTAEN